jgi:phospholipid-transporting ATPase
MRSQESGLHLTKSAAPPAGTTLSSNGNGAPQGWTFDDDDEYKPSGGGLSYGETPSPRKRRWKPNFSDWKWPWHKEEELSGERVVTLNNPGANTHFKNNFVSTSKYNLASFIPKFLFGACRSSLRLSFRSCQY